ncbi:MAG: hypothetical protein DI616_15830 [Paracoccus denitrificans]|uniref:Uncharacterized protein n=1 Tax=Paracoccus denitrificans TaxID=266 RepID=A0A533I0H2_PARDE|nr:MAG: hypothetical protein DI616_15830 [Paracoccus denitrificans]
MATELKPQIHAYIAYEWIDYREGEGEEHDPGYWKLLGWDTVNAEQLSKYQGMMGNVGIAVYLWEFGHPLRMLFRWSTINGWLRVPNADTSIGIPKDLRMKVLCGAI